MVNLNLPRILVIPMSVLLFALFVIQQGLDSGFTYLTLIGGIITALISYFFIIRLKLAEFDNATITFLLRQPKNLIGKKISLKEIQKVIWLEHISVKIQIPLEDGIKECVINGENNKIL
jgi:hypothetical protein